MRTRPLGSLGEVSRITLGGGGLGGLWGETTGDEGVATIHAAVEAGVTLIDTAPMYRDCEAVVGAAFAGRPPPHLRFTTKCFLGSPAPAEVAGRLDLSLDASLATMRLEKVDLFLLHSNLCEDDYVYERHQNRRDRFATRWSLYAHQVVAALEALVARGRIGAWGITGVGIPRTVIKALGHRPRPAAVQVVANLLDSAGSMRNFAEAAEPRSIIAAARANGVGVMGIRAVQAGALTRAIDRPLSQGDRDAADFDRAAAFRRLCARWGEDPAMIAHRYALGLEGVDTLIIGVKNRIELAECLRAEALGPLAEEMTGEIDALGLR